MSRPTATDAARLTVPSPPPATRASQPPLAARAAAPRRCLPPPVATVTRTSRPAAENISSTFLAAAVQSPEPDESLKTAAVQPTSRAAGRGGDSRRDRPGPLLPPRTLLLRSRPERRWDSGRRGTPGIRRPAG